MSDGNAKIAPERLNLGDALINAVIAQRNRLANEAADAEARAAIFAAKVRLLESEVERLKKIEIDHARCAKRRPKST